MSSSDFIPGPASTVPSSAKEADPIAWLRDAENGEAEWVSLVVCSEGDPGAFPVYASAQPAVASISEPLGHGWFSWPGGSNPVPGQRVEVLCTGDDYSGREFDSEDLCWLHSDSCDNIFRYRVIARDGAADGSASDQDGIAEAGPGMPKESLK